MTIDVGGRDPPAEQRLQAFPLMPICLALTSCRMRRRACHAHPRCQDCSGLQLRGTWAAFRIEVCIDGKAAKRRHETPDPGFTSMVKQRGDAMQRVVFMLGNGETAALTWAAGCGRRTSQVVVEGRHYVLAHDGAERQVARGLRVLPVQRLHEAPRLDGDRDAAVRAEPAGSQREPRSTTVPCLPRLADRQHGLIGSGVM